MLKYVMKVEKEVAKIVFKEIPALSPTLCWEAIQKHSAYICMAETPAIKIVMLLKSTKQTMSIPRLLCGVAA